MFLPGLGRVWRFMMAICSTTTVFFLALTLSTRRSCRHRVRRPRGTWSPLRMLMVLRSGAFVS